MTVASSTFVIYKDNSTKSPSGTFKLSDYRPKEVQSISGTFLNDQATLVVCNLPKGVVLTLMEHLVNPGCPSLKGAGRTYDIIGTGGEQTVKLFELGLNDAVSAFFWRSVDLKKGTVTFFEHNNYTGVRQTIFLSEWDLGASHNLDGWFSHDRASGVKWTDVPYNTYVNLFEHVGAGGRKFANIKAGSGQFDLASAGFNDMLSSFYINRLKPKEEQILDVVITDVAMTERSDSSLKSTGSVNGSNTSATINCSYTNQVIESTEISVTDSHSVGGAIEYTYEWQQPVGGSWALKISFNYNYSRSETKTANKQKSIALSVGESYTVPPNSAWKFDWLATSGQANLTYTTNVKRWYEEQVPHSEMDQAKNLYLVVEQLTGTFKGSMHLDTRSSFTTTPL